MTCIIGIHDNGTNYIAGDSACVPVDRNYSDLMIRRDQKVFPKAERFLIGVSGCPRTRQLVKHSMKIPPIDRYMNVERYMSTDFVMALDSCLEEGKLPKPNSGLAFHGSVLCLRGKDIMTVLGDYQVEFVNENFAALGSGGGVAEGSLWATRGKDPFDRIALAMKAAEYFCQDVSGPFHVYSQMEGRGSTYALIK